MALTQEEITRIKAHLEAGKPLSELEELKPVVELGITVFRTETEDSEIRESYAQRALAEKFKETDAKAYSNFEKSIKDATGVEKQPNEATTAYFERAYKEKLDAEVTAAKTVTGEASEESKRLITALQEQLATQKATHDKELSTIQKQAYNTRFNAALEREKAKVLAKLDTTLEGEVLDAVVEKKMNDFKKAYKLKLNDDDSLVALDDKDLPVQDATTFKPRAIDSLLSEQFATLPKKEAAKQQGAGGQGTKPARTADGKFVPPSEGFKSRVHLTESLMEAGFADGTPEFTEQFNAHAENLPLR